MLSFLLVYVIYPEEGPGESGGFAEGDQKGAVDLALRVDEDATEEEDESAGRKDKRGYELEVNTHDKINFLARWHDLFSKFLQIYVVFESFRWAFCPILAMEGVFFVKFCGYAHRRG